MLDDGPFTTEDVAEMFVVPIQRVRDWTTAGKLKISEKVASRNNTGAMKNLYSKEEVLRFANERYGE